MKITILLVFVLILSVLIIGCPSQKMASTVIKFDIPEELRNVTLFQFLDSSLSLRNLDTSLYVMGRDGFTYLAKFHLNALKDSANTTYLFGSLEYTKSGVGYESKTRMRDIILKTALYCCAPHPKIHCAATKAAAIDTTSKYNCSGWKVFFH